MRFKVLLIGLALFAASTAEAKAPRAAPHGDREPVVVELFTAQGCSDCPQANDLLVKLAEDPGVLALTFAVDYWDYLGWRDTFAKPEFATRQRAYQKAMKLRDVYTPQVIVGGSRQLAGVKPDEVEDTVKAQKAVRAWQPDIRRAGPGRVGVGSGKAPRGGATVWLVRYDGDLREVEVKKGDNKGQTIRHANVVRELVRLGDWRGRPRVFRLPAASAPGLKTVILLQGPRGGRILGAKRL
jgi:hypothetical protein